MLTGDFTPGDPPGTAQAMGVAPDGVDLVRLESGRGSERRVLTVRVKGNIYVARYKGTAVQQPRLFFHTSKGWKRVGVRPERETARNRRLARRSRDRDTTAGPKPAVVPRRGARSRAFTVRMRVASPSTRDLYVVSLTGQKPGDCSKPFRYKLGVIPATRGEKRGLVKAAFGPGPNRAPWCVGSYRGTITRKGSGGKQAVVGRFSFEITG
jgi:hypothetical protein